MFTKLWQGFEQFGGSASSTATSPRLFGGQAEGCAPVAAAFAEERRVSPVRPDDDRALARDRQPGRRRPRDRDRARVGRRDLRGARGRGRPEHGAARRDRRASSARPPPASRVGALRAAVGRGELGEDDRVVVLVTGTGLKTPQRRARRDGSRSRSTPTSTRCSTSWGSTRDATDGSGDRPVIASLRDEIARSTCGCSAIVNARLELVEKLRELQGASAASPFLDPGREDVAASQYLQRANTGPLSERRRSPSSYRFVLDLTKRELARCRVSCIVCLPGDGIGPEVIGRGRARARARCRSTSRSSELPFGGAAIDAVGDPLPAETLAACRAADAVLLGAVGGPQWDGGAVRPEAGLIGLRKELDVYANLRPGDCGRHRPADRARARRRPLLRRARRARRRHRLRHVRVPPRRRSSASRAARSSSRAAARPARSSRSTRRTCSRPRGMWRRVVDEVAADYPDVELRHGARRQRRDASSSPTPRRFDVLVMENTFGDILSDVAAAVTGGLGLAASASLGDGGPGIFEPVHGSAPDIAGTGAREPGRDAALARAAARARARRAASSPRRSRRRSTRRSSSRPTPDLGGDATTARVRRRGPRCARRAERRGGR